MSRNVSRTPFFHRNRVRKRRVAMATASVVAAITAATVFLCIRPVVVPSAMAGALPAAVSARADQPERRAMREAAAGVAAVAMASGAMVTLADRHASDAVRIAEASSAPEEDLGWDYVQLRL